MSSDAHRLAISRLPHRLVVSKVGPSTARSTLTTHIDASAELVDGAASVVDDGSGSGARAPIRLVVLTIRVDIGKR